MAPRMLHLLVVTAILAAAAHADDAVLPHGARHHTKVRHLGSPSEYAQLRTQFFMAMTFLLNISSRSSSFTNKDAGKFQFR